MAATAPAVLAQIGYPCDKIKYSEDVDPYVDKIGGTPIWLDDRILPPAPWAVCEACDKPLLLIVQMWAKLPEQPDKYSRVYYVFACNTRICMTRPGSWRIIKAIKRNPPPASTPRKKGKSKNNTNTPVTAASGSTTTTAPNATSSTPQPKGTPNKKQGQKSVTPRGPPTPSTPTTTALSWDLPQTPSFGAPTPPLFSPSSPGAFGAPPSPSPSRNLADLLALRDKKYAWDEEEVDEGVVTGKASPIATEGAAPGTPSPHTPRKSKQSGDASLLASKEPPSTATCSPEPIYVEAGTPSTDAVEALAMHVAKSLTLQPDSKNTDTPRAKHAPESPAPTETNPPFSAKAAWSAAPTFPAYPLEFASESTDTDSYEHELRLLAEYNNQEQLLENPAALDDPVAASGWAGEAYEKSRPKYLNKAFKRFQKLVEEDPEQCIRYALNGQPSFYSNDAVSAALSPPNTPPPCPRCNAPRTFEFQLMPMILSLLPTEQLVPRRATKTKNSPQASTKTNQHQPNLGAFLDRHACGMDWGTVLVYSCARDCEADPDLTAPPPPSAHPPSLHHNHHPPAPRTPTITYSLEYCAVQVESMM